MVTSRPPWTTSDPLTVKQDPAGNLKPDKAKSTGRIDGIVALTMALGRSNLNPQSGSVYGAGGPCNFVLED